jgi:hypothetical protein
MSENGLVSSYTVAKYKVHTYARVNGKWNNVCLILDLFNREIIGFSAGPNKDTLCF